MSTALQTLAQRVWYRLWMLGSGVRAAAWIPVTTSGDLARLDPPVTTWRAAGTLPVVLLTPKDGVGEPPVGLAARTEVRVASLKALPIGARLLIQDGWWSVDARKQRGPGGVLWVLHCVPSQPVDEGGAP
ncbi:MAG: hypothetical protein ABI743_11710 [bacterium]